MKRSELAKQYFLKGYNCSQSVVLAFKDLIKLDEATITKIASPFGGGLGRMRETCGALSGALIVLGYLYGSDNANAQAKERLYVHVQAIVKAFKDKNGFVLCRDLLHLDHQSDTPRPAERNAQYYHSRKCVEIVSSAAEILEQYLATLK
ncbi:MAG: C-GCAxxG-C-C family protein [Bacilli bacterium]|nr:C-GCAxxG-C-C family protein [Bacilli bacterium]